MAAERLGRQWVGMDLWPNTVDLTIQRLQDEKRMFAVENLSVVKTPPNRTDEGEVESAGLGTQDVTAVGEVAEVVQE